LDVKEGSGSTPEPGDAGHRGPVMGRTFSTHTTNHSAALLLFTPLKIGDTIVVHWAGYTKGYQAKRIDNTSIRDEPYSFVLGMHTVSLSFLCLLL
jgi:hypothetical protein